MKFDESETKLKLYYRECPSQSTLHDLLLYTTLFSGFVNLSLLLLLQQELPPLLKILTPRFTSKNKHKKSTHGKRLRIEDNSFLMKGHRYLALFEETDIEETNT